MRFFNFFKNKVANIDQTQKSITKENTLVDDVIYNQVIIEIAIIISDNNPKVVNEISEYIYNHKKYINNNLEVFANQGTQDESPTNVVKWLVLADILQKYEYMAELDWKEEMSEFVAWLRDLKGTKQNNLTIDDTVLDADEYINDLSAMIDEQWHKKGFAVANFDIQGDCFIVFPCQLQVLSKLQELSSSIGQYIGFAKEA